MLCRVSACTDGVEATHSCHFCNSKYTEDFGRKRDMGGAESDVSIGAQVVTAEKILEKRERQWGTHRFWELWCCCCIFNSRPLCSNLCLIDALLLKSSCQSPVHQIVPPWKLLRPQRFQTKCKCSRHNGFAFTTKDLLFTYLESSIKVLVVITRVWNLSA